LKRSLREIRPEGLSDLLWSVGLLAAASLVGGVMFFVLSRAIRRWAARTDTPADDRAVRHLNGPLRWLVPLLVVRLTLPLTSLPEGWEQGLAHACLIGLILAAGALLAAVARVVEIVVDEHFDAGHSGDVQARAVHTQVRGFRNIARFAIGLVSIGGVLLTFQSVRHLGVSLLASAGVAGVVVGFAAQRSLSTVIAGLQIALSQPIRVGDVVIVEGEWGSIEEITLTYVVVKVWDLRRVVLPITYFMEQPFQNWTRGSTELMGTVFVYADYTIPVDEVRAELHRILEQDERWDGKGWSLLVTNATEKTLELRAMMSAADSGRLWQLRCAVREKLVAYLQSAHLDSLPRVRASLDRGADPPVEDSDKYQES
jgi:small-conductance mechanosensitive channel